LAGRITEFLRGAFALVEDHIVSAGRTALGDDDINTRCSLASWCSAGLGHLPNGFHRIRHYGLLASAGCKTNIARARELIAVPVPVIDPPAEHDDPDLTASAATENRPPCPCCGGRMIIVEFFGRGGAPRGPPSSRAGVRTATP
jgi:hypothetical protein